MIRLLRCYYLKGVTILTMNAKDHMTSSACLKHCQQGMLKFSLIPALHLSRSNSYHNVFLVQAHFLPHS